MASTPPPPPPPTDESGFGTMGGTPGEGMLNDPTPNVMYSSSGIPNNNPNMNNPAVMNSSNSGMMHMNAPYGQQQQQPQQQQHYAPSTPTQQPRAGSITQFATPEHGVNMNPNNNNNNNMTDDMSAVSGMTNSVQQPFVSSGSSMPQQQPTNMSMQASWQSNASSPHHYYGASPPGVPAPPGSFAARSAQSYSQQQQPQQQLQQPNNMMPQQQQPNNMMTQPSNMMMPPPQQQQQQPPGPQYRPTMDASFPRPPPPQQQQAQAQAQGGSFAARSAQAYAQQPPSGMMQPQPQAQPTHMMQQQPQQSGMMQPGQHPQQYQQQAQYQPQLQQQQPQLQQPGPQQQPQLQYANQQQPASQFPSSEPQAPQQPIMTSYNMGGQLQQQQQQPQPNQPSWMETPAQQAVQQRLLTEATRKVQEHAYYMRQAMEKNDLPNVLDRASLMVGQLGEIHGSSHHAQAGHMMGPNTAAAAPPPGGEASQLNPKNYYELHMRALEDMPALEDYLLTISGHINPNDAVDPDPNRITITMTQTPNSPADAKFKMRELYDCTQYCPQVLPRLYLQICAGSALIQSGEVGTKWVMNDLMQATKCVQNPVRGLFLRHYLLQMIRDKLPDSPAESTPLAGEAALEEQHLVAAAAAASGDGEDGSHVNPPSDAKPPSEAPPPAPVLEDEAGTVVDSYQFILANFIEMNKLWVRIQHLPGDANTKDQRKRRERQRNELRILVGTNLVRLSQLEGVTSKIYGEIILPTVLDHIVVCGDPLAQAYLIDCITQVFPDEYHIETLPILLRVCPKLRDKVNVRTILQSLMDRLANYLADEELLDETDTNQVKMNMAQDSFPMFEECVQNVYNARGPKLNAKEVVRLQTALLSFSLRCFKGNMEQVNRCLAGCVSALKQANASFEFNEGTMAEVPGSMRPLEDAATAELEKLLSIPLDSLALKVLQLPGFCDLMAFLPWAHRREVAIKLLKAVDDARTPPTSINEIEQLFGIVEPVICGNSMSQMTGGMQQMGLNSNGQPMASQGPSGEAQHENVLVSKLVHLLDNDDTDVVFGMLTVAREHINEGGQVRASQTLVSVVFASFRLAQRVFDAEHGRKVATSEKPVADSKVDEDTENDAKDEEETAEGEKDEGEASGGGEADGETEGTAKEKSESTSALAPATPKTEETTPDLTPKSVRYVIYRILYLHFLVTSSLTIFACLFPAAAKFLSLFNKRLQ